MNRRGFLQSLLAGAAVLPKVSFASDVVPKRLLILHSHHGVYHPNWTMRDGFSTSEDWQRPLSTLNWSASSLSPLSSFAEKMMVVDGVSMISAEADRVGTRHQVGEIHALTGNWTTRQNSVLLGSSPSLDQLIAPYLYAEGRFSSLEWAVGQPFNTISWRDGLHPAPFVHRPSMALRRISGAQSRSMSADAHQAMLQALQQQYSTVHQSHPQESLLSVQDEIARNIARQKFIGEQRMGCSLVGPQVQDGNYQNDFTAFTELIRFAFGCDLCRVLTLNLGPLPMNLLREGSFEDVHSEAHFIHQQDSAAELMTTYNRVHAEQVASLIAALDGVTDAADPTGGTLLDNTLLLWVSEMADPAHYFIHWPVVMAGGQNWHNLNMGQYIHFGSRSHFDGVNFDGLHPMGPPHQQLLNSIARACGVDLAFFGLPSIQNVNGDAIDCTGVLDALFI